MMPAMIRFFLPAAFAACLALAAPALAQAPPMDPTEDPPAIQSTTVVPAPGSALPPDPDLDERARAAAERIEMLAEAAARATVERNWEVAVENYQIWLEMEPINPVVRMRLGTSLLRAGRKDEARPHLERAVLIEPRMADAWSALGMIYDQAEEGYLALSAYARAVHLEPRQVRHRIALAVSLNARGWRDAAESELRTAISLDEESADAHFNLAVLYLARTPPARSMARRHYREALRLGSRPDEAVAAALEESDDAPAAPEEATPAPDPDSP